MRSAPIIKAAEVTRGTFFRHSEDKEEPGSAAIGRHMENCRGTFGRIENPSAASPGDDVLQREFRRPDAVCEVITSRGMKRGGCVIANLRTALSLEISLPEEYLDETDILLALHCTIDCVSRILDRG